MEHPYARNIENFSGLAHVPIGLAGPLKVHGNAASGDYMLPLATTEAALVASYHRGSRLITQAGGANAAVLEERMERAPAFAFTDLPTAIAFGAWVRSHHATLAAAAERTSRHARCAEIEPIVEGNHVYLACGFETGDAAGQNMVTIATAALCALVVEMAPFVIEWHVVESNLSGDKKASARAFARTRGRRVSADVTIARALVLERLHVSPEDLTRFWSSCAVGASMSGAIGIQGHYANALAALAIATGQDAACVSESATGITRFEIDRRGDLYACVTLPNLVLATTGGGTKLPTQSAALKAISPNPLSANALAEIAAALLLAGELSISASICQGSFAAAHQRLARGA